MDPSWKMWTPIQALKNFCLSVQMLIIIYCYRALWTMDQSTYMTQSRFKLASSPDFLFFWRMCKLCVPHPSPLPPKGGPGNKTEANNAGKHRWWLVRNFLISDQCSNTSDSTTPCMHQKVGIYVDNYEYLLHCSRAQWFLLTRHLNITVRAPDLFCADTIRTLLLNDHTHVH